MSEENTSKLEARRSLQLCFNYIGSHYYPAKQIMAQSACVCARVCVCVYVRP